jgi:hypothetical protein
MTASNTDDGPESDAEEPFVVLISWDLITRTLTFLRSDGRSATLAAPDFDRPESYRIVKLDWSAKLGAVVVYVDSGDQIALELPRFDSAQRLDGRLVVYLDQNHWSTIAKARDDRQRVPAAERAAAEQIEEWVQQRRIVLPISAGHHIETTQHGGDEERFALAVTMMRLSLGWQMRAPLTVRQNEMYEAMRMRFATPAAARTQCVFTLEPYVTSSNALADRSPSELPPEYAHIQQALESVTVTIEVLLDHDVIEPADLSAWVEAQQAFSDWLDTQAHRPKEIRRRSADLHLLRDFQQEFGGAASAAGLRPEQFDEWVHGYFNDDLADMPSVSLYRVMQRQRHMNRAMIWKRNDLADMTHLSCAAAYADFVVAEAHQTAMLNQALRTLGRPQIVSRNLSDAVPIISTALAAWGEHEVSA